MFETFDTVICDAPDFEDAHDEAGASLPSQPVVSVERAWHDAPTRIAPSAEPMPSLIGWDRSDCEDEATRLFRAEDEPGWDDALSPAAAPALTPTGSGRAAPAPAADEVDFFGLGATAQGSQDEHPAQRPTLAEHHRAHVSADLRPTMAEHHRPRVSADLRPTMAEGARDRRPADLQPTMAEHSRARRESMPMSPVSRHDDLESVDAPLTRAEYGHPTFADEHQHLAGELPWFVNGAEPPAAPVKSAAPGNKFVQMPPQTLVTIPAEANRVSPYAAKPSSQPAVQDISVDLRPNGVIGWIRRKVRP